MNRYLRRRVRFGAGALALILATVGCAASAAPGPEGPPPGTPRTVTLDIRHSRFSPSNLDVRAGTTVRFVLRNTDPIAHELIVGDQASQDRHEFGTEAEHGERDGEVSVAAGAVAETSYTFTGEEDLLFGCHLPGHWAYGMRGTIKVV